MPYCPSSNCPDFRLYGVAGEYSEAVSVCPRCGTALVAELPASEENDQPDDPRDSLIVVAAFNYRQDAELAMSFLLSEGVQVVESADDCGGVDPGLGFGTRTRLLVLQRDLQRAQLLLRRLG